MLPPAIIGVVGTAKNTGKTTTLSYLLQQAHQQNLYEVVDFRIGITGIGYDGEEIDTVTSLPKPRLSLPENTIVATSEHCLRNSTAHFETLRRTGIRTALGEVLILRIVQPGLVVIAGPNRKSTLATVIELMKNIGVDILLIDGSLNRLAPMAIAKKIIFTTGASRNIDTGILAEEMKAVERIFSLPQSNYALPPVQLVALIGKHETRSLPFFSLLDEHDARAVVAQLSKETNCIYIPGLMSVISLQKVTERLSNIGMEIIITDPLKLLIAAEPLALNSFLDALNKSSVRLSYIHKPQLAAVTINPFYPKPSGAGFTPAFVDKYNMMDRLQRSLSVPVFNVKDDDGKELLALCVSN